MSNAIDDKISVCQTQIQRLTELIEKAVQAVQSWADASKALSLSAAKARADNQAAGRGFGGMLFPSYRKAARQAAVRSNARISVDVAQKRINIAEGKRAAQEQLRQLKASLTEAKQLLKSLQVQAKVAPNEETEASRVVDRVEGQTGPSSIIELRDAVRIANDLISELAPVMLGARTLFPPAFAEKLTATFARAVFVVEVWESVIAMLKEDGKVSPDEMALYRTAFERLEPSLAGVSAEKILSQVPRAAITSKSNVITLLRVVDGAQGTSYASRYANAVFRILNLVARADGSITPKEVELLNRFRLDAATTQPAALAAEQGKPKGDTLESKARSLDVLLKELDELVGLRGVKSEIKELCDFVRIQQTRKTHGLRSAELSLHVVFSGNPGTGKTTVARLLAEIYAALGVVSKGQLIETDRAGMVAGYTGQTALKVAAVVESARGGVLFIDEAYALTRSDGTQDTFGDEAVETLLKRMEDFRTDLVVVAAGYTEEMRLFIDSNPGLRSRFTRSIAFDDYSPEELTLIVKRRAAQQDYQLSPAACAKLLANFEKAYQARDKTFGNARLARNVFEDAISNQATRVLSIPKVTAELLRTLEPEDLPVFGEQARSLVTELSKTA